MLATLNLQLVMTDTGGESLPLQAFSPEGGATQAGDFAELLNVRVGSLQQQPVLDGQILPSDGNKLPSPETDIAITINDLPVPDAAAAVTPEVEALRIPGLGELQDLPDVDLPKIDIPATDEPLITIIPPVVIPGPVTPAGPVSETAPANIAMSGERSEQWRDFLPGTHRLPRVDFTPQQLEARVAGSGERQVALVPPGPLADRQQLSPRQLTETVAGDEDVNRLMETAGRQPAAPVAAPVIERLAEMMRSRVRPGQPVAAATAQAQPAGFTPLPTTSALSETGFASTLQQQAGDLIRTPVSAPGWGDRIGERVVMLAGNQLKSAEIRLTPAELGPVRVQISVDDGATNVTFQAAHAVTRDALEQALPRLREMLAESGLTLGQADVGEQGVAEGNRDRDAESAAADFAADEANGLAVDTDPEARRETLASNGLVDTFA